MRSLLIRHAEVCGAYLSPLEDEPRRNASYSNGEDKRANGRRTGDTLGDDLNGRRNLRSVRWVGQDQTKDGEAARKGLTKPSEDGLRINLRGSEAAFWLQRFEDEHDNFRSALAHLLESGDSGSALRLAGALSRF